MHRLPLILCAVAVLGSTLSAVLFFRIGNSKQLLELRLSEAQHRTSRLDAELATVNEKNAALNARVGALDNELTSTLARVVAADARSVQLERDLASNRDNLTATKEVLAVYELTARALAEEVAGLRQDLDETRQSNASPEAVAAYKTTIAELERQLATARNGAAAPSAAGASTAVFASRAGRATILTVGPQNAFVVLNFGSARGAQVGHKLSVTQGTAEVATVLISDVRLHLSVAQVLPETLRGVLQKGDLAVLIR
ncbi:hypothetical protein [Horticoccus sp. 23ND18S-11]|uniref:hypothetical protein n=1 Tax=Horticoccus sp. 23ND18S-11 TaxID=3391832 RepID=UPI0039C9387C